MADGRHYDKKLCWQRDHENSCQYRNLATTKHPIFKKSQLTNNLKVITNAAIKLVVYHFFFMACCYNLSN